MDFGWSPDEAAFRDGVRAQLDELVPPGLGARRASVEYDAASSLRTCRELAAVGHLVPHWPSEWGGSDRSMWHHHILGEEMWRRGEPRAPQYLSINFIGPAIMRAGTDEQKRRHLPRIAAGDVLWCQAFSEPDAGSDLSRIRTRARKVDGGYRVSGTKLWISYADIAEYCFLLALLALPDEDDQPTDRSGKRLVLLTSMDLPGISVREVPSVIGPNTYHEVRFDEVFVPRDALLGDENSGWSVVTEALADERLGAPEYVQAEVALDRILQLFEARGVTPSPESERRIGLSRTRCRAARLLSYRALDLRVRGLPDASAAYLARAFLRTARQACAEAITAALSELDAHDLTEADVEPLNAILVGVAGGAYEILLDLVATELTGVGRV